MNLLESRYSTRGTLQSPSDVACSRVYDHLRGEELALCAIARSEAISAELAADFAKLSGLDHPALTRVRDFGLTHASVFYSREVGLSSTLRALPIDSIDDTWIYQCLVGAADGLSALHGAGLVHGLVLPEHLQVAITGDTLAGMRLADAGLRKLLLPASLKARERYDSPEVKAGAEISPASDIYQLGTTLLEALLRSGAAPKRQSRLIHMRARGIDRGLFELLNELVALDPRKRPANGKELRRAVQSADWAMPDRSHDVKALITSEMVGREAELGRFAAGLERGATGDLHAIEFLGGAGMGRSRILQECADRGATEGWTVIPVTPAGDLAAIGQLAKESRARRLFLVDNADRLDAEIVAALRFLVTEAGAHPVLVVSAAEQSVGLPGAEQIELERLASRDLQRLIEPLMLSALNPADVLRAVEESAAGNPLWVQLLLTSWLESGRLRFVHGRPFIDERVVAEVPETIAETISKILASLSREERQLAEAMAVWGGPLPRSVAERILPRGTKVHEALVSSTEGGYRLIGDTVGPVILGAMSFERKQEWHAAFLSALAKSDLSGARRASLLLGAGRTAEGIRALVEEGREADQRHAYATAFRHLRAALEHYPSEAVPGVDRVRLVLDAAKRAIQVGELRWARQVLATIAVDDEDAAVQLEQVALQANVLRGLRHAEEAAERYAAARALIARNPRLQHLAMEVQLDEAPNDAMRGDGQGALRRVETIVREIEGQGPSRLLGLAMQRLGTLRAQLGQTRPAVVCELRCARIARQLGDHQLAARAGINLGHLYRRLSKPRRALMALDRVQADLRQCPHDGLAASEQVNRAELLIVLGRAQEAETALLRAKALRQRSGERARLPVILIDLGYLYMHTGRLEAAAAYYREAIALAEEFDLPIAKAGQSNLGELFLHLGEHEAAERLLQLARSDQRPDYRGITLINLGRLRREQKRYPEALQHLSEAAALLRDSAPQYGPHVILETARVLLDADDVDGASFQLLQCADIPASHEQWSEYQLLAGLIAAARGEPPARAFAAVLDAARNLSDPTRRAETLLAVLEVALRAKEVHEGWVLGQLPLLEEAAAQTDSRSVAIGVQLIRGAVAERFPRPAAEGFASHLQRKLERGGNAIETAMGELMQQLPGAAGAAVFVVGVDADGKPLVSPISRTSETGDGRIRPYRVAVQEFDRKLFRDALAAAGGNVHEAARALQLATSTFRYRAIKLGLVKPTRRDR